MSPPTPPWLPPFEQVVAEHATTVLRVCRAVVGPHDADDAWSDTFASALAAYPRLPADSNLRGWLITIAHHKAIDRYRANGRAPVPVDGLPEGRWEDDHPHHDTGLWQAVASLPSRQRHAVAYRYIADLPYAEVASLLACSEAAARRAAADGIASLRRSVPSEVLQ